MPRTRTLLVAALVAAAASAAATPAGAATSVPPWTQDLVYTVSASGSGQLLGTDRLEATCVFRPDRTLEYGPTYITGIAATNGAVHTSVRCEIFSWGESAGVAEHDENLPVVTAEHTTGTVSTSPYITVCVSAQAQFLTSVVSAPEVCRTP
jgi:hypothetical protein